MRSSKKCQLAWGGSVDVGVAAALRDVVKTLKKQLGRSRSFSRWAVAAGRPRGASSVQPPSVESCLPPVAWARGSAGDSSNWPPAVMQGRTALGRGLIGERFGCDEDSRTRMRKGTEPDSTQKKTVSSSSPPNECPLLGFTEIYP